MHRRSGRNAQVVNRDNCLTKALGHLHFRGSSARIFGKLSTYPQSFPQVGVVESCGKRVKAAHTKGLSGMNYTPEQEQMWNHVVEIFRAQIQKASFEAWIKPMKLFAVTSDEVIVTFDDMMSQSVMVGRYRQRVEIIVRNVFGMGYTLKVIDTREAERQQQLLSDAMLNPKYTFDTFVTGRIEPLCLCGGAGGGGGAERGVQPAVSVRRRGAGQDAPDERHRQLHHGGAPDGARAADDLGALHERADRRASSRKKGTAELRAKMRNVDVLMVDDIQFLSKTTATQEEFFHTFNDLYNNGKQIIISSDRPPNELPTIEERLRSRFGSGLIVDIQQAGLRDARGDTAQEGGRGGASTCRRTWRNTSPRTSTRASASWRAR